MGAWIETDIMKKKGIVQKVAPLVGAWIETVVVQYLKTCYESHPSWVRGLKLLKE